MALGITARFVLPDPEIEAVIRHMRFDAPVPGRTAVIERQFAIDDIGDDIGLGHCQPADRIGENFVGRLVIILPIRIEPVAEVIGAIKDEIRIAVDVHHIRRGVPAEQKCRTAGCVNDPVSGVHRNRPERALLPFKDMHLVFMAFFPDFRGAAPFDDEILLLVDMLDRDGRAGTRDFHHMAAPHSLGPEELYEGRVGAHHLPWFEGQILDLVDTDMAVDRNFLLFHPDVIGALGRLELAVTGTCQQILGFNPIMCVSVGAVMRGHVQISLLRVFVMARSLSEAVQPASPCGYRRHPAAWARFSESAWPMIFADDQRNRLAIAKAANRSGHAESSANTPDAASTTAILPMTSLRLHSQMERTLASPSRYFIRMRRQTILAANARKPIAPITAASGTPLTKTRQRVDPKTHIAKTANEMPLKIAALARQCAGLLITQRLKP